MSPASLAVEPAWRGPLLPLLAVSWALGGLLGYLWPEAAWRWAVAVAVAIAARRPLAWLTRAVRGRRRAGGGRRGGPRFGALLGMLLLACLVGAHVAARGLRPAADVAAGRGGARPACHVARHTSRRVVRLVGDVAGPGRPLPGGGRRQQLEARWLGAPGAAPRALCGRVELRQAASAPPLQAGERVIVSARLRPALGGRNPGSPGPALRWLAEDVGAVAYLDADDVVVLARTLRSPTLIERWRRSLRRAIERTLAEGPPRAVIGALVLGERHRIDDAQRQRFARAGVSHLLAVSGLHLSLVALGVFGTVRWLLGRSAWLIARGWPRVLAGLAGAVAAVGYTLLTGAADSTVRACAICCVLFFGLIVGRPRDASRPLALAALVLLALDPLCLYRPGAQLSFAAVIGILLVLRRRDCRERPLDLQGGRRGRLTRLLRPVSGLLLVTLGATLLTAPLVAHHFGAVSLIGLALNLLAVPLTSLLLLPLALLGALVAAAVPDPRAGLLLEAAGWLAGRLDALCGAAASLPWAAVSGRPSWPVTACLLLILVGLLLRRRRARRLVALAGALALASVVALRWAAPARLELTFLDVGQGDATFVRLPDGRGILVDGGGVEHRQGGGGARFDPGARRVVPFLARRGVDRLALVVASHPHADHAGGLAAVLDAVQVDELWLCWRGPEPPRLYRPLIARARRLGIRLSGPRRLRLGELSVEPLWPAGAGGRADRCADADATRNDSSIVLRLRYGRAVTLLTGDIEREAEAALVDRGRLGPVALLKVPHHGSRSSSTEAFLARVRPQLAVVSAAADNRFGLPHPAVTARYRARGIELLRIDRLGAVVVELDLAGGARWRRGHALAP